MPSADEIKAAMATMKDIFKDEYKNLKTNPDDPDANFAVGEYVCFSKGDWDKGLPMLAKGSDNGYKEAEELELAARDTASTMKSADKWWDLADKEKSKLAKSAVISHAAAQYQKILPELGALDKVKVEKKTEYTTLGKSMSNQYIDITDKLGRMVAGHSSKNSIVELPRESIKSIYLVLPA